MRVRAAKGEALKGDDGPPPLVNSHAASDPCRSAGQGFIGKHHERSHRRTTHTVDSACAPSEGNMTEKSKAGAPSSSNVKDAMPRAMRGFFTLDPSGKETAGGQDGSHGPVNHTNVGLAIERLLRRWTGVWRAQGVGCAARRDWPGPVASGTMASMPDQRRITDSGGTSWRRRVDQACLRDGRQRASRGGPVRPISIVRCQVPASHPRLPDQCEAWDGERRRDQTV